MSGFDKVVSSVDGASPKEWTIEPKILEVVRPDGDKVELVLTPFSRIKDNVLHVYNEQDGFSYDIPTDGEANTLLQCHENGALTPLAAASMSVVEGVPMVTMIQRVKASVAEENVPESEPGDLFKITAIYDRVTHPKIDLLQGENKIKWQEVLLNQCLDMAKGQGFDRLRLSSGFASRFLEVGHELTLAVQQYDYLANNLDGWVPYDTAGKEIVGDQRSELNKVVKRVRDKRIKTMDQIQQQHPDVRLPVYWEKKL